MRIGKSPQNINEELNKMRRLMNFDISQNSHDVLSESNIEKSILKEQINTGRTDQFYSDEDIESDQKFLGLDNDNFTDNTKPKKVNQRKEYRKKLKQMYKNGEISKDEYKNLKRGGVPSWGSGDSGLVKFQNEIGKKPLATNITPANYNLYYGRSVTNSNVTPPITGTTEGTDPIKWELPKTELLGDGSIPFADNMVTPAWDKFPTAKEKFDKLVSSFKTFIDKGGFDYINNVTIQGSADSARPTEDVPHGYDGLDHPDGLYGGETDDFERNQYLADMRAKMYAKSLIEVVKEKTGKDLSSKFNYKKGLNYYGSEGDERGPEFRKITLSIDANDIPGEEGEKGGEVKYSFFVGKEKPGDIVVMFTLPSYSKMVPVLRRNTGSNNRGDLFIPNTDQIDPLTKETIPYSEILNNIPKLSGLLSSQLKDSGGTALFINNNFMGNLRNPYVGEFDTGANLLQDYKYVTGDKKGVTKPIGSKHNWVKGISQDGLTQIKPLWFGFRQSISGY